MRLVLRHALFSIRWNGPWIYIGTNYLKMLRWEDQLGGNRISLSEYIFTENEKQRPVILDWIRNQREANNDSLFWWMTHLAGRNNAATNFFDSLISLAALKSWVSDNEPKYGSILIVCEDCFLMQGIYDNFSSDHAITLHMQSNIGLLVDWGRSLTLFLYVFLRQVYRFAQHFYAARKSRSAAIISPEGEVYLVHQCLDNQAFQRKEALTCRYFTILPNWLESKGKNVVRLPWLFNVNQPLKEVYRVLRSSNCFIPEDWLRFKDYFMSIVAPLRSIYAIRLDVEYPGLEIKSLVVRERLSQMSAGMSVAMFWRYAYALPRWGGRVSFLKSICFFENVVAEMTIPYIWRTKVKSPSCFVGYYHSLTSQDYLAYHVPEGETSSLVYPDVIIANGEFGKAQLINQGAREDRVIAGPALRQSFDTVSCSSEAKNGLVLLLSLDMDASVEMMITFLSLNIWIKDNLKASIIVKLHPMVKTNRLLAHLNWTDLPPGWRWHHGEMAEVLTVARCCVACSSASIYDVLLAGCVALPISRELKSAWNYADVLQDEFPMLKSLSKDDLRDRLLEVLVTRQEECALEFKNISERVRGLLNEPNDRNLELFIKNYS